MLVYSIKGSSCLVASAVAVALITGYECAELVPVPFVSQLYLVSSSLKQKTVFSQFTWGKGQMNGAAAVV